MTTQFGEEALEDDVKERYDAPRDGGKYVTSSQKPEDENRSLLDELVEVAEKKLDGTVRFPVNKELRPGGWVLEFSKVISAREIRDWARAASKGGKIGQNSTDTVKTNAFGLLDKNVGIYKGTQQIFDEDGDPLTLTSTVWLEKVCKQNPKNYDAVAGLRHFLGDAEILKMGTKLNKEAGYDDDLEAVDPTQG